MNIPYVKKYNSFGELENAFENSYPSRTIISIPTEDGGTKEVAYPNRRERRAYLTKVKSNNAKPYRKRDNGKNVPILTRITKHFFAIMKHLERKSKLENSNKYDTKYQRKQSS